MTPRQHWDLAITLDDATSQHYSMFFVETDGTASSFQRMVEVAEHRGLPSSLYTDRGSHYWHTPEAGGKVDRVNPTQFARCVTLARRRFPPIPAACAHDRSRARGGVWV